ncbi:3'-5' exonuclease [Kitasatospora sp. LaBMicrA B282]|uniref:3'-5' exonuclease n=1 Tax=Kitasatospora sp. LaBMicrA B282 TaxID=3420949 RepID=UPI003D10290D
MKVVEGIDLRSKRLQTVLTARRWSAKGVAAVIDTETTDLFGRVCEVAAIDAHTGRVLIDTLVNPEVPNRATHIHGITDAMVADAPTWEEVLPKLRRGLAGRTLLAYNSEYDRSVIASHTESIGRSPGRLADAENWWCLMEARSAWGRHRRYHLGGGHRALGDCEAAKDILAWVAEGRGVITVEPQSSSPAT